MTIHRMTTACLTLALVVTLTGCAATTTSFDNAFSLGPATRTTATPTATPKPVAGDTDGDGKVSAFEKQVLDASAPKAYRMPDGSTVRIDPAQPLPAAVVKVIAAKALPLVRTMQDGGEPRQRGLLSLMAQADAALAESGRGVIYVYPTVNQTRDANGNLVSAPVWATTASGSPSTGIAPLASRSAIVSAAHDWAAPRDFDIIEVGK